MKKAKRLVSLLIVLALVFSSIFALVACTPTRTVTFYAIETNDDGTVKAGAKIAEAKIKEGEAIVAPTVDGYIADGDQWASIEDYQTTLDDNDENDKAPIEVVGKENISVYGFWVETGLASGSGYTNTYAMSVFPTVWNPFTYTTATDSEILGYISDGFYTFDYNETETGYQIVPAMAVGQPVDVTANYADTDEVLAYQYGYVCNICEELSSACVCTVVHNHEGETVTCCSYVPVGYVFDCGKEQCELTACTEEHEHTADCHEHTADCHSHTMDCVKIASAYVDAGWGILEGSTARAWKITLRSDLKWENGDPITAHDFVRSTELLLDPRAMNGRADDYTYAGNFVIHNAKNYLYQGQSVLLSDAAMEGANFDWEQDLFVGLDTPNYLLEVSGICESLECEPTFRSVYFDAYVNYYKAEASKAWKAGTDLAEGAIKKADYATEAEFANAYVDWKMTGEGTNAMRLAIANIYAYLTAEDTPLVAEGPAAGTVRYNGNTELQELLKAFEHSMYNTNYGYDVFFTSYIGTFPELDFDKVGIKALSDTELVFILDQELEGFYLLYSLTSSWLVHEETYLECESYDESTGIYSNNYGTSKATTMSYGTYKLTSFQRDKVFTLEKNANSYEIINNPDLYQTTNVKCIRVANASTRLQMFLSGQLDSYGLTVDDMDDYALSDSTYYTAGESTFFIALNPNKEALEEKQALAGDNINKTILTVKEFRQALSFSLDRAKFCLATSPTNKAAFAAFSDLIVANPDEGIIYRETPEAKQAVVEFWGLADDIGEGKRYPTIDDAIASITGYDLAGGKELFNKAYDIAIAQGLMDADDVIEICIGLPSASSSFYNNGYEFLVNNYTEAVKGTKLEGKLTFTRDDTIGNAFGERLRDNTVDLLFGVGFTGSALNPYGLVSVYTSNDEDIRYDQGWDTTLVPLTIAISGLEEGVEGVVDYTASLDTWTKILDGKALTVTKIVDGAEVSVSVKLDSDDYSIKLPILAAVEQEMLKQYDMIPLMDDSSASLKTHKYEFYKEEYIYGVGRGGIKYMTYNYTDSEWAAYVAEQGGTLNYK